jgi:hypothetical protein
MRHEASFKSATELGEFLAAYLATAASVGMTGFRCFKRDHLYVVEFEP